MWSWCCVGCALVLSGVVVMWSLVLWFPALLWHCSCFVLLVLCGANAVWYCGVGAVVLLCWCWCCWCVASSFWCQFRCCAASQVSSQTNFALCNTFCLAAGAGACAAVLLLGLCGSVGACLCCAAKFICVVVLVLGAVAGLV